MPNNRQFWRYVALIGLAHTVVLIGVVRWNAAAKNAQPPQTVVWLSGDSGSGAPSSSTNGTPLPQTSPTTPAPEPSPAPAETPEPSAPVLASAKSEIELPAQTATPTPAAKPSLTPLVKAPAKPSPRPPKKPSPKPTPRPTPRPTARPTPKPKPKKMVLAKASPRPKPEPKSSLDDEEKETRNDKPESDASRTTASRPGNSTGDKSTGDAGASAGSGTGAVRKSELESYSRMLHDRLYSEWVQPTSTVSPSTKMSTLVRLRIEKDGRVSNFEIIRPSGNVMVDDSVAAVGRRVSRVDPLPSSLGGGGHYDLKINFELNSK